MSNKVIVTVWTLCSPNLLCICDFVSRCNKEVNLFQGGTATTPTHSNVIFLWSTGSQGPFVELLIRCISDNLFFLVEGIDLFVPLMNIVKMSEYAKAAREALAAT